MVMNKEDLSSISSVVSTAQDACLNSSTNVDNELIHEDRVCSLEVPNDTNGSIPAAQASIEKETKKRPWSKRKRGLEAKNVKVLGDEGLKAIGQITALSSTNDEVGRFERDKVLGEFFEEIVNDDCAVRLVPADLEMISETHTNKKNVEVKKVKRPKKRRKRLVAAADLDGNIMEKTHVAQSLLAVESRNCEAQSNSGLEDEEIAGVHLHPIINQEELVLHTPPDPFAGANVVRPAEVSPLKKRSRRKRQNESSEVSVKAEIDSKSECSHTLSGSGQRKDIKLHVMLQVKTKEGLAS